MKAIKPRRTIKFFTLGCKVNQYESQSIRERFLARGFREVAEKENAGYFLINTCTVTASADQKSRNIIRQCVKANPHGKVIVTGCLAQKDSSLSDIAGISLIISKNFFPDKIQRFCGHLRAFLKVQDGCNNFCSYCKVPLARGRSRSRKISEILKEAKALVASGHREIVLTGICLGAWGKDFKNKLNLVDLINALEKIKKLSRIRLSSIEAGDVNPNLIRKFITSGKLCRHLHIPIQSGDDEILKKMNRGYSGKGYLNLINKIKKLIPRISITTDVIVGFPGETDENFANTVKLLKKVIPLRAHIFPYSRRPGTKAGLLAKAVNPLVIRKRINSLKLITDKLAQSYRKQFIGREVEVLFEGPARSDPAFLEGYSGNYIKVITKSKPGITGRLMRLRVKSISGDCLIC